MGKAEQSLLRWVYRSIRSVAFSFVCVLVGSTKVRLHFAQDRVNKLELGVDQDRKKPGFITSDRGLRADYPYDFRCGLPFLTNRLISSMRSMSLSISHIATWLLFFQTVIAS